MAAPWRSASSNTGVRSVSCIRGTSEGSGGMVAAVGAWDECGGFTGCTVVLPRLFGPAGRPDLLVGPGAPPVPLRGGKGPSANRRAADPGGDSAALKVPT